MKSSGIDESVLETFRSKKKFEELFHKGVIRQGDYLVLDLAYSLCGDKRKEKARFMV